MIKTVSFAPPRSARAAKAVGKSASKPAPAQPAPAANAATSSLTQPARVSSGSSPISQIEEKSATPRRRAATKTIAPEVAAAEVAVSEVAAAEVAVSEVAAAEVAVSEIKSKVATPKKSRAAKVAPATAATSPASAATDANPATNRAAKTTEIAALVVIAPVEIAREASKSEPIIAPKIKRSRVPKDLALQYGASPESDVAPRVVAPKPAPRKRLTREAKAARSQMLRPDDGVLQRLQQANAIEVKKPASRGRGWEFECGRCGRISRFQTPGAICACGAIAVRE